MCLLTSGRVSNYVGEARRFEPRFKRCVSEDEIGTHGVTMGVYFIVDHLKCQQ
jgi:hypothetical protein